MSGKHSMIWAITAAMILTLGSVVGSAHKANGAAVLPITRSAGFLVSSFTTTVDAHAGYIFTGNTRSNSVRILDARAGSVVRTVVVEATPQGLAVDSKTRHLFIAIWGGEFDARGRVTVLDEDSGKVLRTVPVGVRPTALAVDATTGRVFVTNHHTVSVLDARTGSLLHTIAINEIGIAVTPLTIDEQTNQVFAASSATNASGQPVPDANVVSVLDATTGALRRRISIPHGPIAVSVDNRINRAYISNTDGSVSILDIQNGRLVRTIPLAPGTVAPAIAVDSQTSRVFVASYDYITYHGHISTLDAHSGTLLKTAPVGNTANAVVVVEQTGRAFALSERGISVLDAGSGRLIRTIPIRPSPSSLAVDPDGSRVVVSDNEGRVHILDAHNGDLLPK